MPDEPYSTSLGCKARLLSGGDRPLGIQKSKRLARTLWSHDKGAAGFRSCKKAVAEMFHKLFRERNDGFAQSSLMFPSV